ncbi:hypothetical protein BU17DRAFT_53876 [Hysterangium stoloniferum]|nr:hypothetical protein BU17DRAFT_53876 [Hysterangium stoloniferum]
MTPANDAFTLNNRYSYSHSRRSPRPATRSPSPTTMSLGKLTRRNTKQQVSHNAANGSVLHDIGEDATSGGDARQGGNERSHDVKKIDLEIPRKLLHSSIGFIVVPLYLNGTTPRSVTVVLSAAFVVVSAADALRLYNRTFEKIYERCLGFLMRESEKHKINGVIWYLLGVLFSLNVYPLDIAIVSILILSWADTAASTFGRLWGRYTPALPSHVPLIPFLPSGLRSRIALPFARRKSLAGFIAASITAGAIAFGFWGWIAPMASSETTWTWDHKALGGWMGLGLLSIVSALVGGVAEALDLGSLDDNLTLPIISGGAIWGFTRGISALF